MAQRSGERLGVFGGTFDPPHVGHLIVAVNVRHALSLDRVLFVVANVPWQKVGERQISDPADRLAMVEAAVEGVDGLVASSIELARGGESYTADTLEELHDEDPQRQLVLIVGSDAASGLDTWKRVDVLQRLATTVVVDRPGATGRVAPEGWAVTIVEVPSIDVSSSDLRQRFCNGRPLDFLLPPAVIACARERSIYG